VVRTQVHAAHFSNVFRNPTPASCLPSIDRYTVPTTARVVLIADIHGDARALEDALAQIDRLGCDHILCAGDLIGYGRFSEEVVHLIRARRIPTCRGNHDRWAVGRGRPEEPTEDLDDASMTRWARVEATARFASSPGCPSAWTWWSRA
jgi:hypothetical protein